MDIKTECRKGFDSHSIVSFAAIKNDWKGQVNKPGQITRNLEDEQKFRIYALSQEFSWAFEKFGLIKLGLDYRYLDAESRFKSELRIDPAFQELLNYSRPERTDSKLVAVGIER